MSLELNDVIILMTETRAMMIEMYQAEVLGQHRKATNLALTINKQLLECTTTFSKIAVDTVGIELDQQPRLKLI